MKRENTQRGKAVVIGALLALPVLFGSTVHADTFTSPNYTIDASGVGNSIAGPQGSTNYSLTSSGGESVIGNGAGGSYKLGQGYVPQLEQSLQMTVQSNGLMAYYPMDAGTGTRAYDSSTNNNHGTLTNGPAWTTGKVGGQGVSLDGSDDYVQVPHSSSLESATLTTSLWVKLDSALTSQPNSYPALISMRGSNQGFALYLFKTQEELQVSIGDGTTRTIYDLSVSSIDWTQWHHVAFSYDGTTLTIYIDGLSIGQTSIAHGMMPYTGDLWIGGITDFAGSIPDGTIDEVKLFNRALSGNEIKAEYDAGVAGNPAGLGLTVTPGVSQTRAFDTVVQTDAPGYSLAINQNQNLTSGSYSIPAVSGSIASPATWTEGTTKGLGFTLFGTNATAIDSKWNTGNDYAALPGSGTSFYTRTGYTAGTKDYLNMRLRLDVNTSQEAANYTNQMTITGTMTP